MTKFLRTSDNENTYRQTGGISGGVQAANKKKKESRLRLGIFMAGVIVGVFLVTLIF